MSTITMLTLSKEERIVLDIVSEYLNRNRQFKIGKILGFIIHRFKMSNININDVGIKQHLESLVRKKYLVEGSKLTRETVLDNESRHKIYKFILINPGTYFNKILKGVGTNNYNTVWHIDILEKFQFIKRELYDNRYIYFHFNMDFEAVKPLYFAKKKRSRQIFRYLQENNIGISKTHIGNSLNMHPNTITRYLDSLESLELIKKEIIDDKALYFPN